MPYIYTCPVHTQSIYLVWTTSNSNAVVTSFKFSTRSVISNPYLFNTDCILEQFSRSSLSLSVSRMSHPFINIPCEKRPVIKSQTRCLWDAVHILVFRLFIGNNQIIWYRQAKYKNCIEWTSKYHLYKGNK